MCCTYRPACQALQSRYTVPLLPNHSVRLNLYIVHLYISIYIIYQRVYSTTHLYNTKLYLPVSLLHTSSLSNAAKREVDLMIQEKWSSQPLHTSSSFLCPCLNESPLLLNSIACPFLQLPAILCKKVLGVKICHTRCALSNTITNSHQETVSGQACNPPGPHMSFSFYIVKGVLRYPVPKWLSFLN
jgi:hypothetical protein